jgi:SsrA-binding protein
VAKKNTAASKDNRKVLATNRRAFFDYEILDRYEAGLVLTGTEIKSMRAGRVDLRDAYARPQNGELWLSNLYIAPFDPAGSSNHDPRRPRKLLLHRDEIERLTGTAAEKGYTIVALRLYIKNHVAKAELALARGKRQYDKRQSIINRELDMEARRAIGTARG